VRIHSFGEVFVSTIRAVPAVGSSTALLKTAKRLVQIMTDTAAVLSASILPLHFHIAHSRMARRNGEAELPARTLPPHSRAAFSIPTHPVPMAAECTVGIPHPLSQIASSPPTPLNLAVEPIVRECLRRSSIAPFMET
jgi:hypothetical protein